MREIPGLLGYMATAAGTIVSERSGRRRPLKRYLCDGYWKVTVSVRIGGRHHRRPMDVHRLMLLAFKGAPPDGKPQGRHLNGDSTDNRAGNLEWGSAKDNTADAMRHGTIGPGELAHRRKLGHAEVLAIRERLKQGEADKDLAREYGLSLYYPTKLAMGLRWSHVAS